MATYATFEGEIAPSTGHPTTHDTYLSKCNANFNSVTETETYYCFSLEAFKHELIHGVRVSIKARNPNQEENQATEISILNKSI